MWRHKTNTNKRSEKTTAPRQAEKSTSLGILKYYVFAFTYDDAQQSQTMDNLKSKHKDNLEYQV